MYTPGHQVIPQSSSDVPLPTVEAPPSYDSIHINLSNDSTVFMRINRQNRDIVIERSDGNGQNNHSDHHTNRYSTAPPNYNEIDHTVVESGSVNPTRVNVGDALRTQRVNNLSRINPIPPENDYDIPRVNPRPVGLMESPEGVRSNDDIFGTESSV